MKNSSCFLFVLSVFFCSCMQPGSTDLKTASTEKKSGCCNPGELSCKLTSPELQERKNTVIASLRKQVVEKNELADGYSFKFNGSDAMLDELTEFIKTERQCCDFFSFTLHATDEKSFMVLDITGPEGAKEFIVTELEM